MKVLNKLDTLDNINDGTTRKLITKTTSSGSGNAVSSVSVSGDTITYTKGVTAITAHQNAFSNVKVGSTTVAADQAGDTLELVAGSNVTLTPDATNDKVTIAATGAITGVSVNGTSVATSGVANITSIPTNILTEPRFQSSATTTTRTLYHTVRANRLAFLPPDQVIVEQSIDAGTTWTDAGWSDYAKKTLFSGLNSGGGSIPLKEGVKSTSCMLRITFSAMKYNVPEGTVETEKYNYWSSTYVKSQERYCTLHNMYFWLSSNSDRIWAKLERATGANPNSWTTAFDTSSNAGRVGLTGWSGMDFITFNSSTFGGGTTQTGNYWNYRLTFRTCTNVTTSDATLFDDSKLSTSSTTSAQSISGICGYGDYCWGSPNSLMSRDHLYTWDADKNAVFPADVKGSSLTSTGALTVGGNITANSGDILLTKNGSTGGQQVKWSLGSNDYARVYGAATASNAGYLEMATADDSNEPIYARQYSGNFATLTRTATLLDASGNTSFPGTLTANKIDATKLDGAIKNGVTATTQSAGDNSTKVATTAYVDSAVGSGSHCVEQSSTAPTDPNIVLWIEDSDIDGSGGGGTSIEVIDSLISTSTTDALSANQGRVLNGRLTTVENSGYLTTSDIVDALNSTSTTDALSANQGKQLNTRVAALENDNLDSRLDALEADNLDSRLDAIEAKNLVESTNISKIVMVTSYPSTPDPDTLYIKVASL